MPPTTTTAILQGKCVSILQGKSDEFFGLFCFRSFDRTVFLQGAARPLHAAIEGTTVDVGVDDVVDDVVVADDVVVDEDAVVVVAPIFIALLLLEIIRFGEFPHKQWISTGAEKGHLEKEEKDEGGKKE